MNVFQCLKSELDLFAPVPIQKDVLKAESIAYNPLSTLDSASLEFLVPGNSESYKDLSRVFLRLVVEIPQLKAGQTDEADDTVVANLLQSLFKQINIYLNNTCVSQAESTYHYRSYLEKVFNYGEEQATTSLKVAGFIPDKSKFDSFVAGENSGIEERRKWLTNGRQVELFGRVHGDLFNMSKYLLNNVDMRLAFIREKPEFYMMGDNGHKSEIKILEANLFVHNHIINPQLLMSHEKLLDKHKLVNYPIKRMTVRNFTVNSGIHTLNLDNIVIGQLPNVVIFGMVNNEAFYGKRSLNPFNFQRFDLSLFQLSINGQPFPSRPIEITSDATCSKYARAYHTVFSALNLDKTDKAHQITPENYLDGYFFLAFDVTRDASYGTLCGNLNSEGSLRIEAKFLKPLPKPITAIIGCEFDGLIQIDKNRNVSVAY